MNKLNLEYLYWTEEYSISEIAKMYNVCKRTIWKRMKKQGVKTRSLKESLNTQRYLNKRAKQIGAECPNYKHGCAGSRVYKIWKGMKKRCYNPKTTSREYYYSKRIKVCPEWLNTNTGFIGFGDWAMENGYTDDLVIHRKKSDGNYCPENTTFMTKSEHAKLHNKERRI